MLQTLRSPRGGRIQKGVKPYKIPVETESETAADLAYLRGRGTSLGGLRPKCTVVDDDGRLAVGKFPSVKDERAVTRGEVLAMQLAKEP